MKRSTAVRYANEVAARVKAVNGLLATPLCNSEAVRIKRIWVFGSTVKGSQSPNDLDLLIEMETCGRTKTWQQTKRDKRRLRDNGLSLAPDSADYAFKWLTKGMKKVSRHWTQLEFARLDVKVLIYPRMDLTAREDYRGVKPEGE